MSIWVDFGNAATRDHEMQTVGRNRPVKSMERRARRAYTKILNFGIDDRSHDVFFIRRRLSVRRNGTAWRQAPWINRERLGRCAAQRRGGSGSQYARKSHTVT